MPVRKFEDLSSEAKEFVQDAISHLMTSIQYKLPNSVNEELRDFMTPTKEEQLRHCYDEIICQERSLIEPNEKSMNIGFHRGCGFEITKGMAQHPEWWDRDCQCDDCMTE